MTHTVATTHPTEWTAQERIAQEMLRLSDELTRADHAAALVTIAVLRDKLADLAEDIASPQP